jgi:RND family efflux transporter MFP subunit
MNPRLLANLAVLLGAATITACSNHADTAPAPVRPVRLVTVAAGGNSPEAELAGAVRARVESRMGFRVAGKIISRHVEVGQHVHQGEELMRIDARDYQLSDFAGKSGLAAARASLDVAESEYHRFVSLHEKGFVSQTDVDRRRSELAAAQAQFSSAQSSSAIQGNQVGDTILKADADGVVEAVNADVGEVVGTGQPVVVLAHDGEREIEVDFPEDQMKLAKEAAVEVNLWAAPAIKYPAKLRELAAAADPVARTFRARYSVTAPAGVLALGQSATLHLRPPASDLGKKGVYLPTSALVDDAGKTSVWVYDPASSTVHRVPVLPMGVDGNQVLAAGIPAGTQVVNAGVHILVDGQKVRPLTVAAQ